MLWQDVTGLDSYTQLAYGIALESNIPVPYVNFIVGNSLAV